MRNLLFVGVDQLRWDSIGPRKALPTDTPTLDMLIADGMSFPRSYATCPLCTPSRASMFTGDYAFRHGMGTNCDMYHALGMELAEPQRLLHHDFTAAGYRCGFVGKWHVGVTKGPADYGFEGEAPVGYGNLTQTQGFQDHLARAGVSYTIEPTLYFNPDSQTLAGGRWRGPAISTPSYFQTEQAIEMMRDFAEDDRPFYITVQYWDPHGPHLICDEFWQHTDRSLITPWANFDDDLATKPKRVRRERDDFYRRRPCTHDDLVDYIGLYCDHVAMLDRQIGRLLTALDNLGLKQDTLVAFTSDHGDMTGAHGGLIDKGLPYEEAMRVPLVFSNPELGQGERSGLALNMDVLPTALSLLGVDHEPRHARNLAPEIREQGQPSREYLLAEYHGLRFLYSQRILVSDDGWKYVFSPGDDDELYNLTHDPREMTNLATAPETADMMSRMRNALMAQTAQFDDPLRDCVAKFNGQWRTSSDQFDVTSAYLKS